MPDSGMTGRRHTGGIRQLPDGRGVSNKGSVIFNKSVIFAIELV